MTRTKEIDIAEIAQGLTKSRLEAHTKKTTSTTITSQDNFLEVSEERNDQDSQPLKPRILHALINQSKKLLNKLQSGTSNLFEHLSKIFHPHLYQFFQTILSASLLYDLDYSHQINSYKRSETS